MTYLKCTRMKTAEYNDAMIYTGLKSFFPFNPSQDQLSLGLGGFESRWTSLRLQRTKTHKEVLMIVSTIIMMELNFGGWRGRTEKDHFEGLLSGVV